MKKSWILKTVYGQHSIYFHIKKKKISFLVSQSHQVFRSKRAGLTQPPILVTLSNTSNTFRLFTINIQLFYESFLNALFNVNKYHRACQSLVLEILGCLLYNPLRNLKRYKNIPRISSPVKINLNYFCFSIFKTKSYFSYEFNKIVFTLLLEINAINFSALNISTRLTPAATSQ